MKLHTIIFTVILLGSISTLFLGLSNFNNDILISPVGAGSTNSNSILLLLYNNNSDNNTIQQIITERGTNSLPNQFEYVRIQDSNTLSTLENNQSFMSRVKEYWFVANNITKNVDLTVLNSLLSTLMSSNASGLILTPDINNLSLEILSKLKISSCNNIIDTENHTGTIQYPNYTNLTQLLNSTIPSSNNITLRMTIANCTYNSGIYQIAQIISPSNESDYSPTLLLYQPDYKSRIIVGTFSIYTDESNISSHEVTNQAQISVQNIFSPAFNIPVIQKNQVQNFTIYRLLALITLQASLGFGSGTSSNPSNNLITLPNINFNPPTWFFPLTIILALASIIIYLLYKFWYAFLGLIIAITTLIYHPYRKLDALDVLKHSTRQKIIDILYEQAGRGETFRSLNKKVKIPVQTLLWHLKILQDFSLIETFKIRRELVIVAQEFVQVFYPLLKVLELSFKSPHALSFRVFLGKLINNDTFTLEKVIEKTNWNRKTAQRHLNYLYKLQILNKDPRTNKYSINSHYYNSIRSMILIDT